jgi:hypothetical protein
MTRGGRPVRNHTVKLWTNYVNGSGGHDHTDYRRPDNNNNYGYFLRTGSTQQVRPLEGTTDALGRINNLTYGASVFGDEMKVYLKSTRNKLFKDSVTIIERITNLNILSTGNNYVLVGGTCNHHGPRDDNDYQNCRNPNNNHYGTARLINAVQAIADSFHTSYHNLRLRINDMSLSNGGGFDISGHWDTDVIVDCNHRGHCTHRIGTNADISFYASNTQDQRVTLTNAQQRKLILIITGIYGTPNIETTRAHFHLQ